MESKLTIETTRVSTHNEEYEKIRSEFIERFDSLLDHIGKSHTRLYSFLAYVYCLAHKIDNADQLRSALVTDVERIVNSARPRKRRWHAHRHDSFDLLLTLRTKLAPDLAASKSGWLLSLRAASELVDNDGKPAPVEPTEKAFIEWITPLGVAGARRLAKHISDFNLCEFAEGMAGIGNRFTIDLPKDVKPPEDLVEVIGRIRQRNEGTAEVEVLGVITDEKRIRSVSAWYLGQIQKENSAHARKLTRAAHKYAQKEYGDPGAPDVEADYSQLSGDDMRRIEEHL